MDSNSYFNQVANQWDEMRGRFFSDKVREKALTIAGVRSGRLAADIGCGTGFITGSLIAAGLCVIAVDQSAAMLTQMREKFPGTPGIDFRLTEMARLPVACESVDFVFANMYLHHVDAPETAICEMARILKPEGRLVITDLDAHEFTFLRDEHHDRWLGFEREKVKRWLAAAGLRQVSISSIDETCCTTSNNREDVAQISIFAAFGQK